MTYKTKPEHLERAIRELQARQMQEWKPGELPPLSRAAARLGIALMDMLTGPTSADRAQFIAASAAHDSEGLAYAMRDAARQYFLDTKPKRKRASKAAPPIVDPYLKGIQERDS